MSSDFFLIVLAALIASVSALTVHIFVQKWSAKRLPVIIGGTEQKHSYSRRMNIAAYITASISALVLTVVYYIVGGALGAGGIFLKAVLFSVILLEIKGKLFREPVMNYLFFKEKGIQRPIYAVLLTFADQWASGLVLGFAVTWICPVR